MNKTGHKTVVEYEYDDKTFMKIHEDEMISNGWFVSATSRWSPIPKNNETDFYREYTYIHEDGIFL